MLFNSIDFILFFAVAFALYSVLPHLWRKVLLLVASYIFYGCWDVRFLSLLAFSTIVDFFCAHGIDRASSERLRRALLGVSLTVNLGLLMVFKYFNFFIEGASDLLQLCGMQGEYSSLDIILPVGISFYTFQTLSYTIDVFKREMKPTNSILDFATYVAFFPQLVAGPIERASNLLPQFVSERSLSENNLTTGLWLTLLGFFKKLVIADRCALLVNAAFSEGALPYAGPQDWVFLYAFAFQIYGDFSGYSDIARGIAKMMGYDLMLNFRKPFLVTNPADFWRHWHISLSTWLRDYLYIGLGGNRGGTWFTYRNLMITMLLGGLWHGAGWAYLLWGAYQGGLLVLHRLVSPWLKKTKSTLSANSVVSKTWNCVTWIVFFHLTCVGWLLFRAGSLPTEVNQLDFLLTSFTQLFTAPSVPLDVPVLRTVAILGAMTLTVQYAYSHLEDFRQWSTWSQVCGVATLLIAITTLGVFEGSEFIYFQF